MHRPPNYTDSAYFIHRRYEDTALVIFRQNQKKKGDSVEDHYFHIPQFSPTKPLEYPAPFEERHPLHQVKKSHGESYSPPPFEERHPLYAGSKSHGGRVSPPPDYDSNGPGHRSPSARDIAEKYRHISPKSEKSVKSTPEKSLNSTPEKAVYSSSEQSGLSSPEKSSSNTTPKRSVKLLPGHREPASPDTRSNYLHDFGDTSHRFKSPNSSKSGNVSVASGGSDVDAIGAEGVSRVSSGVEFGHYGSSGVVARRKVAMTRTDTSRTQSKVCALM